MQRQLEPNFERLRTALFGGQPDRVPLLELAINASIKEAFLDCDIGALHPLEPQATDIREIKTKYGQRLCLIGNLDLEYTLTRGTPKDVAAQARALICDVGPGGGYCVSSSNSIPSYVLFANFQALVETTLRHGRYPLE